MLPFALIPLAAIVTALAGLGFCAAAGVDPHGRAMGIAGGICLVASLLGVIPLVLTRGASQYAVAQGSLVATILHLFVTIGAATFVVMNKGGLPMPALYWLLAFYWATLGAIVFACVRAVRSARTTATPTTALDAAAAAKQ
jgi:hypothetical protein